MAMTLASRVTDLTGIDTALVKDEWLNGAVKDVVNILPPQVLWVLSKTERLIDISYSSVPQSRILGVLRADDINSITYECMEIPFTDRGKANQDSGYLEESTTESPVFYKNNNTIFVLPKLEDNDAYADIIYVDYPIVDSSTTSISKFPNEVEHLVVLKAAIKAKLYQIGQSNKEEDIEIATSHTNHMGAINQEYTIAIQGFMSGIQINVKEQDVEAR